MHFLSTNHRVIYYFDTPAFEKRHHLLVVSNNIYQDMVRCLFIALFMDEGVEQPLLGGGG